MRFGSTGALDVWLDERLTAWFAPNLIRLVHNTLRKRCPLYVVGLIGPGERKSMVPRVARVAVGKHDRLHHFISDGV